MKTLKFSLITVLLITQAAWAQTSTTEVKAPSSVLAKVISDTPQGRAGQRVVVITGTRFVYPLVQKWIDDYNKVVSGGADYHRVKRYE